MSDDQGNIIVQNQRPAAMVVAKLTPFLKRILQQYYGDNEILQVFMIFF